MRSIPFFLVVVSFLSCKKESKELFIQVPSEYSNIFFSNNLIENEKYNVYDYHNVYNGGGIAAFDINNDGLTDLYFTGNQVNDKLYLNKGNFVFEDITETAGIVQNGWSTGVTVADINADGLLDFYVCKAGNETAEFRKNKLYINQGNLTFKEEAEARGIADTSVSTQAAFFDYDKDGDLDLYVLTSSNLLRSPNNLRKKDQYGNYAIDKLYRNDGTGNFEEVGLQSGITENTHGLGLAISDVNGDGWEDILASSDFLPNDALYINNKDGTFTNKSAEWIPYQSRFSMGNDIADINDDGKPEMITVDMLPPDDEQQKKMLMTSYHVFETEQRMGYQKEFTRNMLFQNLGNDPSGETNFSEIGQYSGVHATDWSWAPLLMDFDNDGRKDLYISNGYMRDVTNSDNISYNLSFAKKTQSAAELREFMNLNALNSPRLQRENQFFQNLGSFSFSNKSDSWLSQNTGFSNGAVFADLDNYGDLDYLFNNINENASIYRNKSSNNYLIIKLEGDQKAIYQGVKIEACIKGNCQTYYNSITRGYLSAMSTPIIVGLGKEKLIDSLRVVWTNGKSQLLKKIQCNQTLTLKIKDANETIQPFENSTTLFSEIPFEYRHEESRFIDFYRENLLLRKYSQPGPIVKTSDLDNNGLEDIFFGGNKLIPAFVYSQINKGQFAKKTLTNNQTWEDAGVLFLDTNGDGFQDLYTLSGSNEFELGTGNFQDHIYLNDGHGNLVENKTMPLKTETPGSVICSIDLNNDGVTDIFRGAGVLPGKFPETGDSFIFLNLKSGFQQIGLGNLSLITDAISVDYNNDGWEDLVVVGEYMPPTLFLNNNGKLSKTDILGNKKGLWNSVASADLDADGFKDLVLGNKGLNYRYLFDEHVPLELHHLDLNKDGSDEVIQTYYQNGKRRFIPARDELIRQYPYLKSLFPEYNSYAISNPDNFGIKESYLEANFMKSTILWNDKGVGYIESDLPTEAQQFEIHSILLQDFNQDGQKDILLAGNDYDSEPINAGYTEGSKGCFLLNIGKREFKFRPNTETGIWLKGATKSLVWIENKKSSPMLLAAPNDGQAKLYKFNSSH